MEPSEFDKRAPMGFQGMRGKKEGYKRTNMGFVGMRGKRNVNGFYEIADYHDSPKSLGTYTRIILFIINQKFFFTFHYIKILFLLILCFMDRKIFFIKLFNIFHK